jgi:hypothetical protein
MAGKDKRPLPKSQSELIGQKDDRTINRANEVRRDDDNISDFNIGLYDHDGAISYYFQNVIKPKVVNNGNIIDVPILYGSPERWKAVQKGYFYRDQQGKVQVPLIMYKRTSVEKNRNLTAKIDANNPRNFISYENNYSQINKYDKFSILNGIKPQKVFHNVIVPDYVKLTYECIIWTDYIEHMNKIVEAINYAEGSYWGQPERYKFLANIDSFTNESEAGQGTDRQIRSTFTLTLNGYIVPDAIQKDLAKFTGKSYSMSRLVFNEVFDPVMPVISPTTTEIELTTEGGVFIQTQAGYDLITEQA